MIFFALRTSTPLLMASSPPTSQKTSAPSQILHYFTSGNVTKLICSHCNNRLQLHSQRIKPVKTQTASPWCNQACSGAPSSPTHRKHMSPTKNMSSQSARSGSVMLVNQTHKCMLYACQTDGTDIERTIQDIYRQFQAIA